MQQQRGDYIQGTQIESVFSKGESVTLKRVP